MFIAKGTTRASKVRKAFGGAYMYQIARATSGKWYKGPNETDETKFIEYFTLPYTENSDDPGSADFKGLSHFFILGDLCFQFSWMKRKNPMEDNKKKIPLYAHLLYVLFWPWSFVTLLMLWLSAFMARVTERMQDILWDVIEKYNAKPESESESATKTKESES